MSVVSLKWISITTTVGRATSDRTHAHSVQLPTRLCISKLFSVIQLHLELAMLCKELNIFRMVTIFKTFACFLNLVQLKYYEVLNRWFHKHQVPLHNTPHSNSRESRNSLPAARIFIPVSAIIQFPVSREPCHVSPRTADLCGRLGLIVVRRRRRRGRQPLEPRLRAVLQSLHLDIEHDS